MVFSTTRLMMLTGQPRQPRPRFLTKILLCSNHSLTKLCYNESGHQAREMRSQIGSYPLSDVGPSSLAGQVRLRLARLPHPRWWCYTSGESLDSRLSRPRDRASSLIVGTLKRQRPGSQFAWWESPPLVRDQEPAPLCSLPDRPGGLRLIQRPPLRP
jgi:hypothetical protein